MELRPSTLPPVSRPGLPGTFETLPWLADRRWILGFALLALLLTGLPYLMGYARQGEEWRYSGFLFGVEDGNSYIAKMLQGAEGAWLFRTPYTPLPQNGVMVYIPYLLLGKLTAPPGQHEQLVALYQLFRLAAGLGLVFATYAFLAVFLRHVYWRRIATVLVVLGGGLGWLSAAGAGGLWGGQMPLDFYSPEAFGFLMLFGLPHLTGARALLLWGLRDYLTAPDSQASWRTILLTGLVWNGAGLLQPITIIVGWAVLGAHIALTGAWQVWLERRGSPTRWDIWRKYLRRALLIGLLSAPLILYTYASFKLDPILRGWEAQNRLFSPPLHHYLLVYALLLPLAILGTRLILKGQPWEGWLVAAWAFLFPLLIYLPVGVQRRLVDGAWIAIVILAVRWVESRGSLIRRLAPVWFGLALITPLLLLSGAFLSVWTPQIPLFRPAQEVEIFNFLAENAQADDIVLASFQTSNPLPAWAPITVVTGHGPEGVNSQEVRRQVDLFYSIEISDKERTDFLEEIGIDYVIWGPAERALGGWDPRQAGYLTSIFESGPYLLLRRTVFP